MYKLPITFRSAKRKKMKAGILFKKAKDKIQIFGFFENIGNIQFINGIEALYLRETHNMKEAWTL